MSKKSKQDGSVTESWRWWKSSTWTFAEWPYERKTERLERISFVPNLIQ